MYYYFVIVTTIGSSQHHDNNIIMTTKKSGVNKRTNGVCTFILKKKSVKDVMDRRRTTYGSYPRFVVP